MFMSREANCVRTYMYINIQFRQVQAILSNAPLLVTVVIINNFEFIQIKFHPHFSSS